MLIQKQGIFYDYINIEFNIKQNWLVLTGMKVVTFGEEGRVNKDRDKGTDHVPLLTSITLHGYIHSIKIHLFLSFFCMCISIKSF